MSLDIRIDHDIENLKQFMSGIKLKALPKATRKALNKTLDLTRTRMNREFRDERKIKIGELKKRFQKVNRARGNRIAQMIAEVIPSIRSVSLIKFVVGKKEPRRQSGISVRRRRLLRTEVRPGKKLKRAKLFIARGRGGNYQVFQRMRSKRFPIGKRAVPSFAKLFKRTGMGKRLEAFAGKKWPVEWTRAIEFEMNKIKTKRGK
jgi:hypothetical protein